MGAGSFFMLIGGGYEKKLQKSVDKLEKKV